MRNEVQKLRESMVAAGWKTTKDPNFEWWHYNWQTTTEGTD